MVKYKLQFQLLEKTTTPQNKQTNKKPSKIFYGVLTPGRKEIEETWTESLK